MADLLAEYRRRRDPARTPEPAADDPGGTGVDGPAFVVQEHHASSLHWDLRLEREGVLVSWAVPKGLPAAPGVERLAVHTEDHPLAYARFEGTIPEGEYGGGWMRIVDVGPLEVSRWTADEVELTLRGALLQGRHRLRRRPDGEADHWTLTRLDPPTDPRHEAVPDALAPMLAEHGEVPTDDGWSYEVKWDGHRALARVVGGRVALSSRGGHDRTASVPGIAGLGEALAGRDALLDGELVVLGPDGRPDFGLLQQRMGAPRTRGPRVTYLLFDVLHLDGHSLLRRPHAERRALLDSLALHGPVWATPAALPGRAQDVLAAVAAQGLEGVVAKRADSPYTPGRRSPAWRKLVNLHKADVVVGGWQPGAGRRQGSIGSLLLGVPDADGLRYVGHVGTGFTDAELGRLSGRLDGLARAGSPFTGEVPAVRARTARWVEPELAAEVAMAGWTSEGLLRQPRWRGLVDRG